VTGRNFIRTEALNPKKHLKMTLCMVIIKSMIPGAKLVLTMLYENGAIVKSRVEDEPDIEIVNKHDQAGNLIYSGPYRNKIPVGVHREYGKDGKVTNCFYLQR
jgi:antitoxin component YwqK of YwqJK toxin-antitoxin module